MTIFTKKDIREMDDYFKHMTPKQARELDAKAEYESSKDLSK